MKARAIYLSVMASVFLAGIFSKLPKLPQVGMSDGGGW